MCRAGFEPPDQRRSLILGLMYGILPAFLFADNPSGALQTGLQQYHFFFLIKWALLGCRGQNWQQQYTEVTPSASPAVKAGSAQLLADPRGCEGR